MSGIDYLTEQMNDLRSVKGLSEVFDQQIRNAEIVYRRAEQAARCGDDSGFLVKKAERSVYFLRFEFGQVKVKCVACNGSGRYDHNGSPACGACDGSGKERRPGEHAFQTLKRKTQSG